MKVRTLCFLLVELVAFSTGAFASQATACDRNCLIGMADQYLAAMVKHDPAGLPVAPKYKFTENAATIELGDGLWVGASDVSTTFRIYAADPETGQVAFMGILREFGKPAMLALRLKVVDGQITEVEQVVARQLDGFGAYGTPGHVDVETARPAFAETVPPAERVSRQEMLHIADLYFDAVEQSKGDVAPFADDCVRHENGVQTTTWKTPDALADIFTNKVNVFGCAAQLDTGETSYITRIRPRRLVLVDEEKGLVFSFPMFIHRGAVRSVKLVGVPGIQSQPKEIGPSNFFPGEIFKIRGGKIHEVEAIGTLLPFGTTNGWD
jgi:hypothetical protein